VAVFVGDKASLLRFDTYVSWLPCLCRGRVAPWEVNIGMASNPLVGWSPVWYGGDHTDALIWLRRVIE
jgi:hypothetical protein